MITNPSGSQGRPNLIAQQRSSWPKIPWPRALLISGALLAMLYVGDYLSLVYRIPNGRAQYGTVQVQKLLAVPQKNRQTEYIANPPEPQQCVYSLFPHMQLAPCWYLERHPNQQINY